MAVQGQENFGCSGPSTKNLLRQFFTQEYYLVTMKIVHSSHKQETWSMDELFAFLYTMSDLSDLVVGK